MIRAFLFCFWTGLLASSCQKPFPFFGADEKPRPGLVLPSKDEVARINGKPLSLAAFLHLKRVIPKATTESLLWVGLGAMALQESLYQSGIVVTDEHAIRISRYGVGNLPLEQVKDDLRSAFPVLKSPPSVQEIRDKIDALLSNAEILRNPAALEDFRDR
ncbi:MAG: hypothetical protein JNL01_10560 [Bdellovibrionales bacterium]|nr:hypothetical protein [Bdellovibrionales bacterium]